MVSCISGISFQDPLIYVNFATFINYFAVVRKETWHILNETKILLFILRSISSNSYDYTQQLLHVAFMIPCIV